MAFRDQLNKVSQASSLRDSRTPVIRIEKWPKEFPRIGPLSPAQNLNMLVIELPDFAIRQLSTIRANRRSIRVFTIRKSARPCIAFDLWRVAAGVRGAHPPNTTFTGGNLPQSCPQEFESRVRRRRA